MSKNLYNVLVYIVTVLIIGLVCITGYAVYEKLITPKSDREPIFGMSHQQRQTSYISQSFIDTIIPVRGELDNYYAQHHEWPSGSTAQIHQQLGRPEIIQSDYIQSLLVGQDGTIQVQFTDLIDSKATLTMSPIQLTNETYISWSCQSSLPDGYQACIRPS